MFDTLFIKDDFVILVLSVFSVVNITKLSKCKYSKDIVKKTRKILLINNSLGGRSDAVYTQVTTILTVVGLIHKKV